MLFDTVDTFLGFLLLLLEAKVYFPLQKPNLFIYFLIYHCLNWTLSVSYPNKLGNNKGQCLIILVFM